MNLLWTRPKNEQTNLTIRLGRVFHWCMLFIAIFGTVISFCGMLQAGDRDPLTYISVGMVWMGIAMIGRALRYLLAKE